MLHYAGYGFNAWDITDMGFLKFMREYAPEDVKTMVADVFDKEALFENLTEDELEGLAEEAKEWAAECDKLHYGSAANYIASMICKKTCPGLVAELDSEYVIYPPLAFPDDVTEEKCRFVRNRDDFEKLVMSFFPNEKLTFGRVWKKDEDWMEPEYCITD